MLGEHQVEHRGDYAIANPANRHAPTQHGARSVRRFEAREQHLNDLSVGIDIADRESRRHALESGHLAGAAFDVYPEEPEGNDQEFLSRLRQFENVILTLYVVLPAGTPTVPTGGKALWSALPPSLPGTL